MKWDFFVKHSDRLKHSKFLLFLILLFLPKGDSLAQSVISDITSIEISQVDNSAYPFVTVYVRVLDASGARVDGLSQENFIITEDGKSVDITAFSGVNYEPIRTLLVIDKSGSMDAEGKMEGAKTAAYTFIEQMREQDQAAIIAFDNGVNLIQDFTSDKIALQAQIKPLTPGDCTSWYEAVYTAADLTITLSGRKSLILLSDGMDCREDWWLHNMMGYGSYHSFDEALTKMQNTETPVYSIALGLEPASNLGAEGYDEGRLTRVAAQTGGEYYHRPTADQLAELYQTLARQTQGEYVLTYASPRPSYDGTRRGIQVTIVEAGAAGENAVALSATETYVEEHLLNIESDWLVGAILLAPLLLAVVLPVLFNGLRRSALLKDEVLKQCAQCGEAMRPGAKFCRSCGQPVGGRSVDIPQCPNCGQSAKSGAMFCSRCGFRF